MAGANTGIGKRPPRLKGASGQHHSPDRQGNRHADADDGYDADEDEPERVAAESDSETEVSQQEADEGPRYEVTVDGKPHEVSLQEALNGYVRQETFHQRLGQLNEYQQKLEQDAANQRYGWQVWHKARADYEEDLANLIPKEPNWDELFARDPQYAYGQRKMFEVFYGKLNDSRVKRAQREAADKELADRRTHDYAVQGFSKFIMDNPKLLPDEATLKKNIQSMRRTAMAAAAAAAAGFSEYEVATVYDPRMLNILLKASKYDRMMANKPNAVIPGRGKTLTPGAATPLSGNARRSGFDDAQRRLASSGRLQDAVEVFRRML